MHSIGVAVGTVGTDIGTSKHRWMSTRLIGRGSWIVVGIFVVGWWGRIRRRRGCCSETALQAAWAVMRCVELSEESRQKQRWTNAMARRLGM